MVTTLGGYIINDTKMIYEVGILKNYDNDKYIASFNGNYLIQASSSVILKPKKTSDGVSLIIKVNGKTVKNKEVKTGSLDYSNYDCDLSVTLPLRRMDKVEIYCKSSVEGYLNTEEGKSVLSIVRLIE